MPTTAPTFLWHDYETFGLSPRSDRPAQFAAIRTDADLNEIAPPIMLYCQPAPDYLPSPESCLLTGITPQQCLAEGIPEHAFAAAIERELAQAGTIGVGYNTLRFDDEVTRFLLWRNLIDPYAREWQNQCSRWDLLDLVRATYTLRPEGIIWPQREDGLPSFKLGDLCAANGLLHEAAHDALSDVRATLALARLIRDTQPALFAFYLKLRHKDEVHKQLNLAQPRPLIHVSGQFGSARGNLAVVWPLAAHPHHKNEVLVWDLAHSPAQLPSLSPEAIRTRLFTKSSDLPEGVSRLPIKSIHLNKSPFVVNTLKVLTPERALALGIDVEAALRHAEHAAALPNLSAVWKAVYQKPAATLPPPDVDENLYGGFVSPADRRALAHLRTLSPADLAAAHPTFDDAQLTRLLHRYRARNFPDTLRPEEASRWRAWCRHKLDTGEPAGRTFAAFEAELATFAATADARTTPLLAALAAYGAGLRAE